MSRNYDETHEKILESAKKNFLTNGYERTNLRKICKDANVTTGAFYCHFKDKEKLFGELVNPVVKATVKMYTNSIQQHFDLIETGELIKVFQLSEDTLILIIEFIYDNFDIFKLLFTCADGTPYSSYLDEAVRMDVHETTRFLQEIKKRKIAVNELEEDEMHMLIHSYYSSLSEIVMHDYKKEVALKYARTLIKFFNSGWHAILGI
ncbi:TetR/AcrR family transcriptional regulator [Clostridium sp. MB40-C1]|uniref:TetR/AcrR family transcriptional regulator n=1 Tax=Clostridium sp. MB40-C1 TaxID=3070996 RepID=UPI0027E024D5|nr:TetR/AcrR family transcriptional regulator [Clostridium sp. MB40-C1]WMJ81565.1 TetR/AcrR family transcriptional regulator [Clostridium sp. MB40-C1]